MAARRARWSDRVPDGHSHRPGRDCAEGAGGDNVPAVNPDREAHSNRPEFQVPDVGPSGPGSNPFDRRRLLRGGIAGLGAFGAAYLLDACGGSSETVEPKGDGTPKQSLIAMFPRDTAYLGAGIPSRLIYTVADAEGVPASKLPASVEFSVKLNGKAVGEPIKATPHGDGVPRPYLPITVTFPEKGLYDVYAQVNGETLRSQVIAVNPDEVKMPIVGSQLPSVHTPTLVDPLGVDPICTRSPTCPFHEHDLATALGTGKPVVVLLATPAYCQTTSCGPILDILMGEAAKLPDDVIVIHSEVYKNPKTVDDLNNATLAPLPEAYNMTFEPSLFVTDRTNKLVARADIAVDRVEMAKMLALAV